jgi:hypothetical protein
MDGGKDSSVTLWSGGCVRVSSSRSCSVASTALSLIADGSLWENSLGVKVALVSDGTVVGAGIAFRVKFTRHQVLTTTNFSCYTNTSVAKSTMYCPGVGHFNDRKN